MSANSVILLGYYGGDETHCLSAWQSTNIELGMSLPYDVEERIHALFDATVETKTKSPADLLRILAEHGHYTPFEKSALHFQVTADIATHIHCIKHRIGVSVNSESARYKELKDKWYLPDDWKETIANARIDNYKVRDYLTDSSTHSWYRVLDSFTNLAHELYHSALKELTPVLGRKRAKETARYFLPYNKQLDFDMMFNFRSFMHFQQLRNSEHAQIEIKDLAQSMIDQVRTIPGDPFRYSLAAFGY